MNDSINTPRNVLDALKDQKSSILIMKPNDKFNFGKIPHNNNLAICFWDKQISKKEILKEENIFNFQFNDLKTSFDIYRKRISTNNNMFLVRLILLIYS